MKEWIRRFAAGTALCASLWGFAEAAPPTVPEEVYQWVQSSERMNYFFNRNAIAYGVDQQGYIDLNVLMVPAIKTYDTVQIDDVRMKREWRLESTEALSDLAGEANYLTFDLARQTVTVDAVDLIDSHLWTIEHQEPKRVVEIAALTEKSRDGIFYRAILAYAKEHPKELLAHTKGTLREEDRAYLEQEEKRLEKEKKEKEKQLEKQRREEEKRLEKERKEEAKRLERERKEEAKRLERERKEEQKRLERERREAKAQENK